MKISIFTDKESFPVGVITPSQVHGTKIVEIIDGREDAKECDALITSNKNFSLGIKTADCVPVSLTDGEKIGIAHIGWRGLCSDLYEKVSSLFKIENLEVHVGPFLHSFIIQKDFCFDSIQNKFGEKFFHYSPEGILFDFKGALNSVLPPNTVFDERNTKDDLTLPSHRRNKTKDRFLTVISFE